jgi:hypothetical protein
VATKLIDLYVMGWARRKFKRLRHQTKGARDWFARLLLCKFGALRSLAAMSWKWLNNGSRMK